ncbi:MAG: hypothetical protein WCI91_00250 [Candidatus Nomurabacteria bacterium]
MKNIKAKKENKGYAILFTVVVVGIISAITFGLTNAAYKQMMLSSVARDSTSAFYQADIATECAMYADNLDFLTSTNNLTTFTCGGTTMKYSYTAGTTNNTSLYQLSPQNESSTGKCFRVDVTKTDNDVLITTKVEALGYNICNKNNFRTVERAIEVNY